MEEHVQSTTCRRKRGPTALTSSHPTKDRNTPRGYPTLVVGPGGSLQTSTVSLPTFLPRKRLNCEKIPAVKFVPFDIWIYHNHGGRRGAFLAELSSADVITTCSKISHHRLNQLVRPSLSLPHRLTGFPLHSSRDGIRYRKK